MAKLNLSKYFNYFKFNVKAKTGEVYPQKKTYKSDGTWKLNPEVFPKQTQELWRLWQNKKYNPKNLEDRLAMYDDQDMMYNDSPIMGRTMDLTADEVVQADSNTRVIGVETKDKKLEDFILETVDGLGIEELLRPTAFSVIKYGDGGWSPVIEQPGVVEILPIDVYDLVDRIEFTPHLVKKELMKKNRSVLYKLYNAQPQIKQLVNNIMEDQNYSSYLKSYLFGFQISDFVLPPWKFLHFRNFTFEGPFAPFGIPMYIRAVSAFKMFDMALTLDMMARGANFPRDVFKLTLPNSGSATDKLEKAQEFLQAYENSGFSTTKKEGEAVGEKVITIADLYEYDQESPNITLGRIDDLEMMRDDLIIATGLPRNFLDPNAGGLGDSGIALSEQHKPFARSVYRIQSILLENITQLLKIHMIQSGNFAYEDVDFRLTMPYPEAQTNRDIISSQSDLLGLANDILDSIGNQLMGDEDIPLPTDLIHDVYSKILPYDPETIDKWVDYSKKAKEDALAAQNNSDMGESTKRLKSVMKKMGKSQIREIIEERVYEGKQRMLPEGAMNGKHFYSSNKKYKDFDVKNLIEFKKSGLKRIEEEFDLKSKER